MLEDLKKINEYLINACKNNSKELEKYKAIKVLLNEKDLFLKIDVEYAYSILRDLKIPEKDIKKVYINLISVQ